MSDLDIAPRGPEVEWVRPELKMEQKDQQAGAVHHGSREGEAHWVGEVGGEKERAGAGISVFRVQDGQRILGGIPPWGLGAVEFGRARATGRFGSTMRPGTKSRRRRQSGSLAKVVASMYTWGRAVPTYRRPSHPTNRWSIDFFLHQPPVFQKLPHRGSARRIALQ